MKGFHPMLLLAATMLAVGLACSAQGGGVPITETSAVQSATPVFTVSPVALTPTPTKIPAFFKEEFGPDYPVNHWQHFNVGPGRITNTRVQQEDDHLLFDLQDEDVYMYYMYTPYTYRNTSIILMAENLGSNNNNISLVCRMNRDTTQWYEFSVTSGGLWTLFVMDNRMYHTIGAGGTNLIKQGKEKNEYQMICAGNELTLLVNGQKVQTIQENKYGFTEGFVGFNVASMRDYSVLPITVEVDSFEVTLPK